eukprot:NODE_1205_length_2073_cov_24.097949_g1016_i0.p3 GENE.NODE_1205_length_2073_cov_24.097949_g1016_i0~~NODE_1205_length_2073_cov_24.097949_g1016_i0.p3  ORF type:complete len:105 (+),score=12.93 NODE_1205_length_2073_cov_24.097949_g1016_i0:662-976(+)
MVITPFANICIKVMRNYILHPNQFNIEMFLAIPKLLLPISKKANMAELIMERINTFCGGDFAKLSIINKSKKPTTDKNPSKNPSKHSNINLINKFEKEGKWGKF